MHTTFQAAQRLQSYLVAQHWRDEQLIGPDPGPRFSYRIWRFVKSYLPQIAWHDDYYYLQAQGYWTLGNWRLWQITSLDAYRDIALRCAHQILTQQCADGAWSYPHPEWKGRVANFEGTWGSLGLIDSYRHTGDDAFIDGARRWQRFQAEQIGFQQIGDELSVNYFAGEQDERVPNTATLVLRFLAELTEASGDRSYLQRCAGLLRFIGNVQKPSGELPYTLIGPAGGRDRPHFQCYQYNAFQCLNLIRYYELSGDPTPLPIIQGIVRFLQNGVAADGHALYQCGNTYRAVTYHAAALGAAFLKASQLGLVETWNEAQRSFDYALLQQQPTGGFIYSQKDYRVLSDRRSYPRYLAMMLYHLLHDTPSSTSELVGVATGKEQSCAS